MADPFEVRVGGQKLVGWTSAKLSRRRKDLTGSLTLECFYGSIPETPVLRNVKAGAEIQALVGGSVAFTGKIDMRNGRGKKRKTADATGDKSDETFQRSVSIGRDAYSVTITARGETKRLIDSSHDHPTGTMKQVSPGDVVRGLVKNFGVKFVDASGANIKLEKARFRDGAPVVGEIHRFTKEHNLIVNETRDGTLQMTKPGNEPRGVDLILGQNILEFSAEQSEDVANSSITVKGQRTGSAQYGSAAVNRSVTAKQSGSSSDYSPFMVQITGDATDERLKARLQIENRERQEQSKNITVDVFHVQDAAGAPWDIGVKHYVEVAPEGIYDDFVVDELEYEVDASGTLKTTLTLVAAANDGDGQARSDSRAKGDARRAAAGISASPGLYPDPWTIGKMIFE
ncbi:MULTISPECIES: hypothetical protein [Methylosinus]|uniref:Baseplate hub protein gp44/GpP-like second domain-containing protein n=1 Tax=Methylosinus trichosporium (strain ATCC 35070 / NCIMB 11131 / UNIQEM 75 / OB3b) TaxID=595536 RepID=A0A2D2CZ41_METT3|nr:MULTISPECIES: hypothetical protein [Methylosinus]ATQ67919.1 hypothetical protein CQW49_08485 [Methylosinus trichosporium OB3b]OBS54006.1 hypothetical protein A8B73_02830 [Methylosinus sp. 3S-1]